MFEQEILSTFALVILTSILIYQSFKLNDKNKQMAAANALNMITRSVIILSQYLILSLIFANMFVIAMNFVSIVHSVEPKVPNYNDYDLKMYQLNMRSVLLDVIILVHIYFMPMVCVQN